jgi:hypothetical protein
MATNTLPHSGRNGMMMQRRHFELIAEIISKELNGEHREKAAYAFAYILPIGRWKDGVGCGAEIGSSVLVQRSSVRHSCPWATSGYAIEDHMKGARECVGAHTSGLMGFHAPSA